MDLILTASGIFFSILLAFISFITLVFLASIIIKRKFEPQEPSISIIIPAYNEEKTISKCIESVLESDYPKEKLEVMVVDDGSTDKTREMAKRKKVRLLTQNHTGKSDALNLGIKNSRKEFVLCLDADSFLEKDCIKELVKPFSNKKIGATSASIMVKNRKSVLGSFQNIEYAYHNLIRSSFSKAFNQGVWFMGAASCYRRDVLEKIGMFEKESLTEDIDASLKIKNHGYTTYNVDKAFVKTIVPESLQKFCEQRKRWWAGSLQALLKNRKAFSKDLSPSLTFIILNQIWWSFYATLSLPIIIYQILYWLPYNSDSITVMAAYLFRWTNLSGPLYAIYKIPEWGVSIHSIFGILSGILSSALIIVSLHLSKDRITTRNALATFFYFPYTILLNIVIFISLFNFKKKKKRFYLKKD